MRAILLPILFLLAAVPAAAGEIRLSAAASLTEAVKQIAAVYVRRHPGVRIHPNFGGSGMLAKQIAQGAPVDIFLSANPDWMSFLVQEKRIAAGAVQNLAGNSLVFVGSPERPVATLAELDRLRRLALGSPRSVPAGQYAQEALQYAGLYERLAAAGKLVLAQDVRQALVWADRGEVDGAFVYRTDLPLAKNAVLLFTVPPELHSPLCYPMGLTTAGAKNPDAVAFYAFLKSPEAQRILANYGFIVDQDS